MPPFRTSASPPAGTNSMLAVVGAERVIDRSLPKKSSPCMWATLALDPDSGQGFIIRWGCFCAKAFTDFAARRSELPSRRTGLTAEPSTAPKRRWRSHSSSVLGSSG